MAENQDFRIKDEAVTWIDDDSRVKIAATASEDIKGLMRLRRTLWSRDFAAARVEPSVG